MAEQKSEMVTDDAKQNFKPLFIEKVIQYMNGDLALDSSLSVNDVYGMYKSVRYFIGDDAIIYEKTLRNYLLEAFNKFTEENNVELHYNTKKPVKRRNLSGNSFSDHKNTIFYLESIFTKERNALFMEYSCLFDLFDVTTVIVFFGFSKDISYEYIYPSNLHTIFPKLIEYDIYPYYYLNYKEIRIPSTDFHYELLYKEYKRLYNNEDYLRENYGYTYSDYERDEYGLFKYQIHSEIENNQGNQGIKKDENNNISNEVKEIKNRKKEKPDLYIECILNNSSKYIEESIPENDKNHYLSYEYDCIAFLFEDSNGSMYYYYYSIKIKEFHFNNVFSYILNMPICKQLKTVINNNKQNGLFQIEIPPLLKALRDGYFDTIQMMNFLDFISLDCYKEYIYLFVDIISNHIFPNLTTLIIEENKTDYDCFLLSKLFSSISINSFPKLHILDLCGFIKNPSNITQYTWIDSLISQSSIYTIIDTILLVRNQEEDEVMFFNLLEDYTIEKLIELRRNHEFILHTSLFINRYNLIWFQLYNIGALEVENMYFNLSNVPIIMSDLSLFDLNIYKPNQLYIKLDITSVNALDYYQHIYTTVNTVNLKTLSILFEYKDSFEDLYMHEFLNVLSTIDYEQVNTLEIKETILQNGYIFSLFENHNNNYLNKEDIHIYEFLSLFSDQIQTLYLGSANYIDCMYILKHCEDLPLWTNIQDLTICFCRNTNLKDIFNILFYYFDNNKFTKLKSLKIGVHTESFNILDLTSYIYDFQDNNAIHVPLLTTISILTYDSSFRNNNMYIENVLHSFPHIYHLLKNDINSIIMCKEISRNIDSCSIYNQYIINQFNMDYMKTIYYLVLFANDTKILDTFIDFIINDTFPCLKELNLCIDAKIDFTLYTAKILKYKENSNHYFKLLTYSPTISDDIIM
ncbi:hypothetical protein WA158_003187 [Blastocystis sp. Blastoise]